MPVVAAEYGKGHKGLKGPKTPWSHMLCNPAVWAIVVRARLSIWLSAVLCPLLLDCFLPCCALARGFCFRTACLLGSTPTSCIMHTHECFHVQY